MLKCQNFPLLLVFFYNSIILKYNVFWLVMIFSVDIGHDLLYAVVADLIGGRSLP